MNDLTKKLRNLNNDELYSIIIDFTKLRKDNLEWLQAKLNGEDGISETLDLFKKKIVLALRFESINLSEAKKFITDFKKISKKPEFILELMIFYVEKGTDLENESGGMYEGFYDSRESVFEKIIKILNANPQLIPLFKKRLSKIVEICNKGWGHKESMDYLFEMLNTESEVDN